MVGRAGHFLATDDVRATSAFTFLPMARQNTSLHRSHPTIIVDAQLCAVRSGGPTPYADARSRGRSAMAGARPAWSVRLKESQVSSNRLEFNKSVATLTPDRAARSGGIPSFSRSSPVGAASPLLSWRARRRERQPQSRVSDTWLRRRVECVGPAKVPDGATAGPSAGAALARTAAWSQCGRACAQAETGAVEPTRPLLRSRMRNHVWSGLLLVSRLIGRHRPGTAAGGAGDAPVPSARRSGRDGDRRSSRRRARGRAGPVGQAGLGDDGLLPQD